MESISLTSLASEKLAEAAQSHSGRAADTIHGGHTHELRQTVLDRSVKLITLSAIVTPLNGASDEPNS